jgi:alpha-D-xyloside xylohydrolase
MRGVHEKGAPVMPTCLYESSSDKVCWEVEDQDVFDSQYLVAPILEPGQRRRKVYLLRGAVLQDLGRKGHGWDSGR